MTQMLHIIKKNLLYFIVYKSIYIYWSNSHTTYKLSMLLIVMNGYPLLIYVPGTGVIVGRDTSSYQQGWGQFTLRLSIRLVSLVTSSSSALKWASPLSLSILPR